MDSVEFLKDLTLLNIVVELTHDWPFLIGFLNAPYSITYKKETLMVVPYRIKSTENRGQALISQIHLTIPVLLQEIQRLAPYAHQVYFYSVHAHVPRLVDCCAEYVVDYRIAIPDNKSKSPMQGIETTVEKLLQQIRQVVGTNQ